MSASTISGPGPEYWSGCAGNWLKLPLTFTYEARKQGREAVEVSFAFAAVPGSTLATLPPPQPSEWETALVAACVAPASRLAGGGLVRTGLCALCAGHGAG